MSMSCPTVQPHRLLVSPDGMSGAQQLQKFWITACDAQRRVIFSKVISTGSAAEAQIIAESYVPAEHHGSICITDESDNPAVDGESGLPKLHAFAVSLSAVPVTQLAAEAACA
jgi:hypothetical protein